MAEGLLKKHIGNRVYVQSAGVASDRDIDGFSISVCNELGVELTKHTVRSFQELEEWGEDLEGYDLIIALSHTSKIVASGHVADAAVEVEFWDIADPTATGETRAAKLDAYRAVRDDIVARIQARFPV